MQPLSRQQRTKKDSVPDEAGKTPARSKDRRIRLNQEELDLIWKACMKAGNDEEEGSKFRIYMRFSHLRRGGYLKTRGG